MNSVLSAWNAYDWTVFLVARMKVIVGMYLKKNASNQQSVLLIELVTYVHPFLIIESVILGQVTAILTQIAIVPYVVNRRMALIS